MKAVILAGGYGTRITEESTLRPKPMVEIGSRPILWHIMKTYSHYGINDFIICLGYKGYIIKEYFNNFFLHSSDVTFDLQNNDIKIHSIKSEPWKVTLVETGLDTMTGGRIKRVLPYLQDEDAFCLTYGDGLSDINIQELINSHKNSGRKATVTAVQPRGRFGLLKLDGNNVLGFEEKPIGDGGWINGGYFVLSPKIADYLESDETIWEHEPIQKLAYEKNLNAFYHRGFWHPMDTLRDKNMLERLWHNEPPWKKWK